MQERFRQEEEQRRKQFEVSQEDLDNIKAQVQLQQEEQMVGNKTEE